MWSDNGADGTFSPSADLRSPTWTAPGNSGASPVQRALTVTATCSGTPPKTASGGVTVTEDYRPWVTIIKPTTEDTCTRTGTVMRLVCTASQNTEVLKWYNGANGKHGDCTRILNSIQDFEGTVELTPAADNTVIAEATDKAGNTGQDTLQVECTDWSPAAAWQQVAMVSLPVVPDTTDPKPVVGFEDNYWYLFDPSTNAYVGYPDARTMLDPVAGTPGRGFWAEFAAGASLNPSGTIPAQDQPASIHLRPGWNLIGQPFISRVKWDLDRLQVVSRGLTKALRDSRDAVYGYVWGWRASTGTYYLVHDTSVVPSAYGYLDPWQAFWIKAIKACDLILPAPWVRRQRAKGRPILSLSKVVLRTCREPVSRICASPKSRKTEARPQRRKGCAPSLG